MRKRTYHPRQKKHKQMHAAGSACRMRGPCGQRMPGCCRRTRPICDPPGRAYREDGTLYEMGLRSTSTNSGGL